MNSLPNECLTAILSKLPLVDLLITVPLVCYHWKSLQPSACLSRKFLLIDIETPDRYVLIKAIVKYGVILNYPHDYLNVPFSESIWQQTRETSAIHPSTFERITTLFPNITNIEFCIDFNAKIGLIIRLLQFWSERNKISSITIIWNVTELNQTDAQQLDRLIVNQLATLTKLIIFSFGNKHVALSKSVGHILTCCGGAKMKQLHIDQHKNNWCSPRKWCNCAEIDYALLNQHSETQTGTITRLGLNYFRVNEQKFAKLFSPTLLNIPNLTHLTINDISYLKGYFKLEHFKLICRTFGESLLYLNAQILLKFEEMFPLIHKSLKRLRYLGVSCTHQISGPNPFKSFGELQFESIVSLKFNWDFGGEDKTDFVKHLFESKTLFPYVQEIHINGLALLSVSTVINIFKKNGCPEELVKQFPDNFPRLCTFFYDGFAYIFKQNELKYMDLMDFEERRQMRVNKAIRTVADIL